ncbi:MAG: helix-turn-helix domain-containing protein [Clostridiales bacterium]|nr:helix-turn-helix domain-containing protein [Clostridiales bacterium]
MLVNRLFEKQGITKYRFSKETGVPQSTINDILSGKANLEKCSAGTIYRIAKVLGVSVEDILESVNIDFRTDFSTFKRHLRQQLKKWGDIAFIDNMLESDKVRVLWEREMLTESMYLLGMLDYLARENNLPPIAGYDDIRGKRLRKLLFPDVLQVISKINKNDKILIRAVQAAIPELLAFRIVEPDVRHDVGDAEYKLDLSQSQVRK